MEYIFNLCRTLKDKHLINSGIFKEKYLEHQNAQSIL